ncbi:MAG: hypothetical protein ABIS47_14855 [Acidimicrobiales bacterium]
MILYTSESRLPGPRRLTTASDKEGNKATIFTRAILAKGRLYQLQYLASLKID